MSTSGQTAKANLQQAREALEAFFTDSIAEAEEERDFLVSVYQGRGVSASTSAAVDSTVDVLEQLLQDIGVPYEEES